MRTPLPICRLLLLLGLAPLVTFGTPAKALDPMIAPAINSLGLDLYREQIKSANGTSVLLSPYSIATALAMTYAGADGGTKSEMSRILRLPADPVECSAAFQSLAAQLAGVASASEKELAYRREAGGDATPIQLDVANRIFVQRGYALRPDFVDLLHGHFNSDPAELDFTRDPAKARQVINQWVADRTHDRIRDLLPDGQPTTDTRLALINALYLRAAWENEFNASATQSEPFHLAGREAAAVPTMREQRYYGYAKHEGYSVVTLPYLTRKLQFVVIVPDALDGLAALEKSLTATTLSGWTKLAGREVDLHLPKFKLEPAMMPLGKALQALGMKTAFDQPKGSANFDRMAPRKPDDYLAIGDVYHKTWLELDEHGTEAAAATAVTMVTLSAMVPSPQPPVEVKADRPFLFAIQHVDSGACLFLGRVTDPR